MSSQIHPPMIVSDIVIATDSGSSAGGRWLFLWETQTTACRMSGAPSWPQSRSAGWQMTSGSRDAPASGQWRSEQLSTGRRLPWVRGRRV